jgi:ubiquinone/menaquinone biosynthesis C-methylase UbiE
MDPVARVYETWAERYDSESRWNPAIQMERNSLVSLLNPSKRDAILEIGCGTGRLTRPIARKCKTMIGIDISERMLSVAKRKSRRLANVQYEVADAEKRLPF